MAVTKWYQLPQSMEGKDLGQETYWIGSEILVAHMPHMVIKLLSKIEKYWRCWFYTDLQPANRILKWLGRATKGQLPCAEGVGESSGLGAYSFIKAFGSTELCTVMMSAETIPNIKLVLTSNMKKRSGFVLHQQERCSILIILFADLKN